MTQKQWKFCLAYIETGNASEAYRRAYNAGNMKPETVKRKAAELMENGNITATIDRLRKEAASLVVASEARVIEELARIGLIDPGRLFADDGSLLPIKKMPAEVRAAIASVEIEEIDADGKVIGRVKKIKLWDKNSAADKLLRHFGSYERDNKQRANVFDGVSRETIKEIVGKLREASGQTEPRDGH